MRTVRKEGQRQGKHDAGHCLQRCIHYTKLTDSNCLQSVSLFNVFERSLSKVLLFIKNTVK